MLNGIARCILNLVNMMLRSVSNWRIGLEMVEINERCESHVRVFFHCFKKYQDVVFVLYLVIC